MPDAEPPFPEIPLAGKDDDLALLRKLDEELDAELEQTFPASDPLTITRSAKGPIMHD